MLILREREKTAPLKEFKLPAWGELMASMKVHFKQATTQYAKEITSPQEAELLSKAIGYQYVQSTIESLTRTDAFSNMIQELPVLKNDRRSAERVERDLEISFYVGMQSRLKSAVD
jgi:hypothetical protein